MEAITLPILSCEGKEVDTVKLNTAVFDGAVNYAAIYQAVNAYRANQRRGLAATKTRGEVSGGGKKPWKQKGTGRARVGSTRSPLWRHGGVVFGPHPRDFSYTIPEKIKKLALKSALNAKARENNLIVVEDFKLKTAKVRDALKILEALKLSAGKPKKNASVLFLLAELSDSQKLSLRNIGFLSLKLAKEANVYDLLENKKLLMTKDALTQITNRLKR
jgi:large subunit ribosomal protein L4